MVLFVNAIRLKSRYQKISFFAFSLLTRTPSARTPIQIGSKDATK